MKSHPPLALWKFTAVAAVALAAAVSFCWSVTYQQSAAPAATAQWHRWLGPNGNGISPEKDWLAKWPEDGPKLLWKKSVGIGWSAVSVSNGRAYTMGNVDKRNDTVYCFDAASGKEVWTKSYRCPQGNNPGPRSTPTVDGEVVYTLSRMGDIFCLGAADGKVIWTVDARKQYGARPPDWGFACSPLVLGDRLIVDVGVVLALDKKTGRVGWQSRKYPAGYSTPLPFKAGQRQCLAVFNALGLVVLDAADGRELGQLPWKTQYDVNAATPLSADGKIFISSGYGSGCALLSFGEEGLQVVWRNKEMKNHFSTCVLYQGHLYGIDGNVGGASVKCIDLKTGQAKWTWGRMGMGSLMMANGMLIVLTDRGQLVTAAASPSGFQRLSAAKVISGKCWTAPVLSGGKIYCRSHEGEVVCLDVSRK